MQEVDGAKPRSRCQTLLRVSPSRRFAVSGLRRHHTELPAGRNPKERRSTYNRNLFFKERFTSMDRASERRVSCELDKNPRRSERATPPCPFSYFRTFVIDSISSHDNSLHDKRRGVEVEKQADAEARCTHRVETIGRRSQGFGHRVDCLGNGTERYGPTHAPEYPIQTE